MKNIPLRGIITWTIISGIVVTIANIIIRAVGESVAPAPDTFGPYMISSIVELTLLGAVLAGIIYAVIRRYVPDIAKAHRYYYIISFVALIASFYPDVMMPYSSDPDQVGWTYPIIGILMLMHIVAAIIIVYCLTRKASQ